MTLVRHRVTGILRAESALHIGADRSSVVTDLPVMRDGRDRPLIPGTSIAGALRRLLLDAGFDGVNRWLGEDTEDQRNHGTSLLSVDDAPAVPGWSTVETRLTTAIDPVHGVSLASALFSREILAAGSRFEFSLELEEPADRAGATLFLSNVIRLLEEGITLGAATTRGLGRLKLENVEYLPVCLGERSGFLDFLREEAYGAFPHPDDVATVSASVHTITFRLPFDSVGPLMSAVAIDGAVDRVPLTTSDSESTLTFVLPGSGTKGALRSRARYIIGTLGAAEPEQDDAFRLLFGVASAEDPDADADADADADTDTDRGEAKPMAEPYGRGRLRVHDTTSGSFSREQWAQVLSPGEGHGTADERRKQRRRNLRHALTDMRDLSGNRIVVADRVAIDRWTGGAADQRLFSLLEPHGLTWSPLKLDLDLRGIAAVLSQRAVGLLLLTLQEMAEGWVPLGYGTRRGLGQITIDRTAARVSVGKRLEMWAGLHDRSFAELLDDGSTATEAVGAFVAPYPSDTCEGETR